MNFTSVTANIQHKVDEDVLRRWLRGRFQHPRKGSAPTSLATFQEFAHGTPDFKRVMPKNWVVCSIFPPQPFAFDANVWDLLEMDGYLSYEKTKVGKAGAGPATLTERHVQWLKLRHRQSPRAFLYLFNLHAAPSKQVPLQPGAEASRDELQEKLFGDIADKVEEVKNPVLVQGDFNGRWNHNDNMQPFKQAGLIPVTNPDDIDLILSRGGTPNDKRWQIKKVRRGTMPKLVKTDVHNPLWAEMQFVKS